MEAISEWTPQQRRALHELRTHYEQKEKECPELCRKIRNVAELVKEIDDDQTADCIAPSTIASLSCSSQMTIPQRVESRCSHEEGEINDLRPQDTGNENKTKSMGEKQHIIEEQVKKHSASANLRIKNKGTIVVITSIDS